jgi:hypothetical protein
MDGTFAVAIGGAAGQGVATPGDIFCQTLRPARPSYQRLKPAGLRAEQFPHCHSDLTVVDVRHDPAARPLAGREFFFAAALVYMGVR